MRWPENRERRTWLFLSQTRLNGRKECTDQNITEVTRVINPMIIMSLKAYLMRVDIRYDYDIPFPRCKMARLIVE